uniref:Uncharacterized protein n=1 Tax=Rhizophora mucronata TaxID=61149 RepID=A0A2P2JJM2_RHIMU
MREQKEKSHKINNSLDKRMNILEEVLRIKFPVFNLELVIEISMNHCACKAHKVRDGSLAVYKLLSPLLFTIPLSSHISLNEGVTKFKRIKSPTQNSWWTPNQ